MPELHYPKPYVFTDARRGKEYTGPGTFDVAEDAVEQYLNCGWQRPESDEEGDVVVEDEHEADAETVYDAEAKPAEADSADDVAASAPEDVEEDVADEPPEPPAAESSGDEPEGGVITEDDDADADDNVDQVEYDDLTVSELKEVLNDRAGQFDDERLQKLIDHEKENKNRKGALRALKAHLDDKSEE